MNHRADWHDLPTETRAAVEQHTGPVREAQTAPHGVMSRLACTIRTAAGATFVKGVPHDDPQAWVYRHEAQTTRHAPYAPRALWEAEGGGWQLYGYEYIEGRHPDLSPNSDDLDALVRTLTAVSETPWPHHVNKKPLHARWSEFLPETDPPGLLGRALAHTDMSPHNMLVTPDGDLLLLDWALSCPAPAWADAALAIPRLISAGHTAEQAEARMRAVPAYRAAATDSVTLFACTLLAAWETWERTRPMPHRSELTAAARVWATHRDRKIDLAEDGCSS
ncbi:hypothetical protein [Streptomyces fractus]|uniref:hypothetical protein n=1 Tax=Streptomyces fractus TaxID=641806 RepID=UPI003CEAD9B6